MKKKWLLSFAFVSLAAMMVLPAILRADPYEDIAADLSSSASELKNPKIALVPFTYSGTGQVDDGGGNVVSDRLTTKIVKLKKFQVIDRESLQKVLEEQKLQTSGVVDPETAKKIGKILGVEAIITGSLTNISGGMVEVNAKLIRTETAEIINVSSAKVEKDWVNQPQEQTYEEQPVQKAPMRRTKTDTYIDLFFGLTTSNSADVTFQNNYYGINPYRQLDFSSRYNYLYNKIQFKNQSFSNTFVPFGLRFMGFAKDGYVGGSFDMMYFSQQLSAPLNVSFNGGPTTQLNGGPSDYLSISTFLMDADLIVRYPGKHFQPYGGVGVGLSFDSFNSPYITSYQNGYYQTGDNEFCVGFSLNYLLGVRFMFNDSIGAYLESRNFSNYFSFTRNISNESDSVSMNNGFILLGVSFKLK